MSVPHTPTRWTRTSASPDAGAAGSSLSTRANRPGSRRTIAFMDTVYGGRFDSPRRHGGTEGIRDENDLRAADALRASVVNQISSSIDKHAPEVPVEDVLRHVRGHDVLEPLQRVGVPPAHLG